MTTTNTTNPYQAPSSDINQTGQATYQPEFFTTSGRIGRLRYLAYSLLTLVVFVPLTGLAMMLGGESGTGLSLAITGIAYILALVYTFVLMKRRFNDMDKSGWLSLLYIIPLVNLVIILWLIFGRGTAGDNRFGPMPNENPLSVKIFGLIGPVIFIVGILAAVAIPAYQDYVKRAQAYEISE